MKSLLLISTSAPWSGLAARETLDIALAGGAFDLPVSMLWRDDGVYQLLDGQQPEAIQQKNLQAQLSGLPLFGIEQLYVCRDSLQQRGMTAGQLALDVQVVGADEISALLCSHDQTLVL